MSVRYYLGIDNGLDGAAVLLDNQGKLITWLDTPSITHETKAGRNKRRLIAPGNLLGLLRAMLNDKACIANTFAAVEIGPAMSKSSLANYGAGVSRGVWTTALECLGVEYTTVTPQEWQKRLLSQAQKGQTKTESLSVCSELFPTLPLIKERGRVPTLHGRSDAALIAEWLRLKNQEATKK